MIDTLSATQRNTIVNAMRTAISKYQETSRLLREPTEMYFPRLAEQFEAQAAECESLVGLIDDAFRIDLHT